MQEWESAKQAFYQAVKLGPDSAEMVGRNETFSLKVSRIQMSS